MTAETLVSRLEKVRRTAPGRWVARCPAHADKSPSLAVRELDDGRVLMHCFAECSTESILDAVGMTFEDLFPERLPEHRYKPERIPFPAMDVLKCVKNETLILAVMGANMAHGNKLSMADRERAMVAAERIARAVA
jgi:hypothetical protein